jgi:hypothetical protein
MPSEEEMRLAGFAPEDYADDFFEVWPENWDAAMLFASIANQWRVGMAGPIALDYGVLFARMDRLRVPDDEYEQLFSDVRELEAAALQVFKKKT